MSSASVPIGALSAQQLALLQRRMRFMTLQILNLSAQTLGQLSAVLLAWFTDAGYWSLVASSWVGTITFGILAWTISPWRPSRVRDWSGVRECINFGAYLTGYSLVEYLHRQSDNLLIGWRFNADSLGYYTRAYGLFFLPTSALIYPLFEVAKSTLSRLQDDHEKYELLFHGMLLPISILIGGMAGFLFFMAPVLVPLLYGGQWGPSIALFQNLSICLGVQAILISLNWIFISTGRTKAMFWNNLAMTFLFICGFVWAVHESLEAVSRVYAIVSILYVLPMLWVTLRGSPMGFSKFLNVQAPAPVSSILLIALVANLSHPGTYSDLYEALYRAFLFSVLYIITMLLVSIASTELREVCRTLISQIYVRLKRALKKQTGSSIR